MVVGEPTLMGGEFGDEDERLITRLENQQFEPNSGDPENPGGDPPSAPTGDGNSNPPPSANQFANSPGQWSMDKKPPRPIDEPKAE